jgi:hypothetical protein
MSLVKRLAGMFSRSQRNEHHTATHGSIHGTRTGGPLGKLRRLVA